jgi:ectoine hydroxylase-related dioxygenase (phytanoyl-CoA dioxygenase family)
VLSTVVNAAKATGARSYSSPDLARLGYVLEPNFLDGDVVDSIMTDLGRFADRSVRSTGVTGSTLRDRADRQSRDLNVRQITNVDRLSADVADLVASGRVVRQMSQLLGKDVRLGGMTLQVDWPDTQTKRGLHVDSHWPPTYKAFIYLTSVTAPENGPFSVIPGSHGDRVKKIRAVVGNALRHRDLTDLDHVYDMRFARCLTGSAGTAIFADQRLAHAGWPGHTEGTRFMLVAYLYPEDVSPPAFLR